MGWNDSGHKTNDSCTNDVCHFDGKWHKGSVPFCGDRIMHHLPHYHVQRHLSLIIPFKTGRKLERFGKSDAPFWRTAIVTLALSVISH